MLDTKILLIYLFIYLQTLCYKGLSERPRQSRVEWRPCRCRISWCQDERCSSTINKLHYFIYL